MVGGKSPGELPGESWMAVRISLGIPRQLAGHSPGNNGPAGQNLSVRAVLRVGEARLSMGTSQT